MEIAIISDTHIPSRASEIPPAFEQRIRQADHVIHAGDFDTEGALSNIQAMASDLTAVRGNTDPDVGLPRVATVEWGGVEFVVTHGTGSRRNYEPMIAATVREHAQRDTAVGVSGHTHQLRDTTYEGVRLLNPGSVTGAAPATEATMMTATAENGSLDVTAHRL